MNAKKFATQIDETVLTDLKVYAKSTGRSISFVVSEAVEQYLQREKVRPAFREAMEGCLRDNAELLERLAK